MRAAALTLAFDGFGADVAVSGALEANERSLGVSRKLGYAVSGSHTVSPRGAPVEHTDLELRRDRFVSPVPVEIVGLDAVLPVLGIA
jgi:RimJ/RimL family protein N-acetyltransferase